MHEAGRNKQHKQVIVEYQQLFSTVSSYNPSNTIYYSLRCHIRLIRFYIIKGTLNSKRFVESCTLYLQRGTIQSSTLYRHATLKQVIVEYHQQNHHHNHHNHHNYDHHDHNNHHDDHCHHHYRCRSVCMFTC